MQAIAVKLLLWLCLMTALFLCGCARADLAAQLDAQVQTLAGIGVRLDQSTRTYDEFALRIGAWTPVIDMLSRRALWGLVLLPLPYFAGKALWRAGGWAMGKVTTAMRRSDP